MSTEHSVTAHAPGEPASPSGPRGLLLWTEDMFLVLPLFAIMALPLLELALRRFHTGISGANAFIQHFTLIISMVGGAIAARERQLLSFSTVASFFKGGLKSAA